MKTIDKPTLRETQTIIWKLISAPEGVAKALQEWPNTTLPIEGDGRLSAAERLDIYAHMYFFRIRDCLKKDFPAVAKLLGEERFHNLMVDYLLAHPSEHWSLRYAGRELPRFLEAHELSHERPFLADLARFEWAMMDIYDAADAAPLSAEKLHRVPQERWGELRLSLIPASCIGEFQWPVFQLYKALIEEEREAPAISPVATTILFWRKGLDVHYRTVGLLEAALLNELKKGTSLGELCEHALKQQGEEGLAAISQFLHSWLLNELLT